MIINTVATKIQINEISTYIDSLQNAKKKIIDLKSQINSSWTADEVRYINTALDKVSSEIIESIRLIDILVIDVKNALDRDEQEENK